MENSENMNRIKKFAQSLADDCPVFPTLFTDESAVIVGGLNKHELFSAMFLHAMLSNPNCQPENFDRMSVRATNASHALLEELINPGKVSL